MDWDAAKRHSSHAKRSRSGRIQIATHASPYTESNRDKRHVELAAVTAKPFAKRVGAWENRVARAMAVHAA